MWLILLKGSVQKEDSLSHLKWTVCISFSHTVVIQSFYVIKILHPDRNPDHSQNLTDCSLARDTPLVKIACKAIYHLISNPAGGQTDGNTDKQTNKPTDQKHNFL